LSFFISQTNFNGRSIQLILEKARDYSFTHPIRRMSLEKVCEAIGVEKKIMTKYVKSTKNWSSRSWNLNGTVLK